MVQQYKTCIAEERNSLNKIKLKNMHCKTKSIHTSRSEATGLLQQKNIS